MANAAYPDWLKRGLDLTVLITAHLLLFPLWGLLWLIIPLAIILDSGFPVFYQAKRVGKGGEEFPALKFRTMVQDAERLGPSMTVAGDDRVTRVGSLLRRSGLDELPQLIAIARGDMSFVGPRAIGLQTHDHLSRRLPDFRQREAVRPGLTGLATLYGRADDFRQHLDLDLQYIREKSVWLDLRILFLSVWTTVRGGWESHKSTHNHFGGIHDPNPPEPVSKPAVDPKHQS